MSFRADSIELLRRRVRSLLGYRSPLYRSAALLAGILACLRVEGLRSLALLRLLLWGRATVDIRLSKLMFPLRIRRHTPDLRTIINNIIREEWGQLRLEDPKLIVDAGAYIGDTSAYFLSRYPWATVVALEPDRESAALARHNLSYYGDRAVLLERALWSESSILRLAGHDVGAHIGPMGSVVRSVTIPEILDSQQAEVIDLLKMDIEGAEDSVLSAGAEEWLPRVRALVVEIHHSEVEDGLIPILRRAGFTCSQFRNTWYCVNRNLEVS